MSQDHQPEPDELETLRQIADPMKRIGQMMELHRRAVYSPERRAYGDELLSFSPWHGLAAHRPLGNVMRARKLSYETSAKYRHEQNARPLTEPLGAEDLPE